MRWWVHRAKLQRSHFARMKQRALPFLVVPKMFRYQYCIQMLHKYLFGCFGFYFGCQLSVLSYVHVKPDSPSEIRIHASTPTLRIFCNSDKKLPPDPYELTKYYCTLIKCLWKQMENNIRFSFFLGGPQMVVVTDSMFGLAPYFIRFGGRGNRYTHQRYQFMICILFVVAFVHIIIYSLSL